MHVNICSCREGGQQGMQRLLYLKPLEERWACSALFSCAAQLHTHQQFGAAITLFTAACDAAASGLVRQAKDDAHTFQACNLSHTPFNIHIVLLQLTLHQVLHQSRCHMFLLQAACTSAALPCPSKACCWVIMDRCMLASTSVLPMVQVGQYSV